MADRELSAGKEQSTPTQESGKAEAAAGQATEKAGAATTAVAAGEMGAAEELLEREMFGGFSTWLHGAIQQTPSWLVSMVVHMVILLGLALLTLPEAVPDELRQLFLSPEELAEVDDLDDLPDEPLENIDVDITAIETDVAPEDVEIPMTDELEAAPMHVDLSEFGVEHAPRNDLLTTIGSFTGKGTEGRGGEARQALLRKYKGTPESEAAVALALQWLASHQMPDGGWCFNHALAPQCNGACRNPGDMAEARIGATGMALLPFLGAGQTHKTGKYKDNVNAGLFFLARNMKVTPKGGELWEKGGRMYSHGLASIALCEAYAMTHDRDLHDYAQAAINYICYAQDTIGGGWRYEERTPGDTSVVGWQIMAMKSADMAYLHVPPITVKKAIQFLDSVQANDGANYGYTSPGQGDATSAIGLLCRMYLGWKKDNPALQRGVKFLSDRGPSSGNMYYNYYATQVMRHWEGEEWDNWNNVMRDQLVNSQAKGGHEAGSWYMHKGDHGSDKGGRLYCTAMATMVLEVYYRHLPIYQKQSTEEEFPE